jgi:predicted ArsR family transcriptional regulator
LDGIARPQPLAIVRELKRSGGLPVSELAERLEMSYMGIKKHCLDLSKAGYLTTRRKPKTAGRPELLYQLTEKGNELFPTETHSMTLQILSASKELYGASAAGKLLFLYFRDKEKDYASKLRGETTYSRATWLVRLRDREGYLMEVLGAENDRSFKLIQKHSPLAEIFRVYPEAIRMESEMIERLLEAAIRRETPSPAAPGTWAYTVSSRPAFKLTAHPT